MDKKQVVGGDNKKRKEEEEQKKEVCLRHIVRNHKNAALDGGYFPGNKSNRW